MDLANRKPYLSADTIARINDDLARRIQGDYEKLLEKDEELLVIVTLKGAMLFAADLVRRLSVPLRIDFVRLASYGSGTKSSGTVRFVKDIEHHPEGRHVLVLDEIVDSGRTINFLTNRIAADRPKSLKICALLDKPSRREVEVTVDYIGATVEDRFLIGYGLDYDERYRNLPDIHALDE